MERRGVKRSTRLRAPSKSAFSVVKIERQSKKTKEIRNKERR